MGIKVVPRKRKKTRQEMRDELSPRSKVKREGLRDDPKTGVVEGLKDAFGKSLGQLKPYRPKPKPKPKKKKKQEGTKKKNLLYKGTPMEKRKRSRPA